MFVCDANRNNPEGLKKSEVISKKEGSKPGI